MNETIPDLTISTTTDELIELEQQNGLDDPDRIQIHPLHVRLMAERLGLAPTADPQARRTITTLTRRLHTLQGRISHLADYLAEYSDHQHADLSYEQTYARATADIADEFCAELSAPHPDESRTVGHGLDEQGVLDLAHSYFAAP